MLCRSFGLPERPAVWAALGGLALGPVLLPAVTFVAIPGGRALPIAVHTLAERAALLGALPACAAFLLRRAAPRVTAMIAPDLRGVAVVALCVLALCAGGAAAETIRHAVPDEGSALFVIIVAAFGASFAVWVTQRLVPAVPDLALNREMLVVSGARNISLVWASALGAVSPRGHAVLAVAVAGTFVLPAAIPTFVIAVSRIAAWSRTRTAGDWCALSQGLRWPGSIGALTACLVVLTMPGNNRDRIELLPPAFPADGSPAAPARSGGSHDDASGVATPEGLALDTSVSTPSARITPEAQEAWTEAPTAVAPAPANAGTAAGAVLQASSDALRRQIADLQRQVGELQQQNAQRSHDLDQRARDMEQGSHDLDAARAEMDKLRQDIETPGQQRGAAGVQLEATRDGLQLQIADLLRQAGELQQQVANRTRDLEQSSYELDARRAETTKLRKDLEALEQLRKTQEQQIASIPARPSAGPSTAVASDQQGAPDEPSRQIADLQQLLAQRSQDLDSARAEAAKLRQDIAALAVLPQEQQSDAAASGASPAVLAEQETAQDALRRKVADLQQQGAQRSQDLDAARAEAAKLRQDLAALESKTQEQQASAASAGMPMATPPTAEPTQNGTETVALTDPGRMSTATAAATPGDVAHATAATGPTQDGEEAAAVTDPARVPATTEAPRVQVDLARAGARAGQQQPGAEAPVGVIVVTARPGKTRAGSDLGTGRGQTVKSVVPHAIALDTRANATRPCDRAGGAVECPASDRRGLAAVRPMPIAINTLGAVPSRCLNILKRVQLGEALTDDDRAVLQTNCGPG